MKEIDSRTVSVIGGGPAGLMAAEQLLAAGLSVSLFDAMPSVGRKFLLAGVGGMNITHSEPTESFYSRYYEAEPHLRPMLDAFDAAALREWLHQLGIETFVGSSGKVFPTAMKAAPMLRAWLARLKAAGLRVYTRHRWLGWDARGDLLFAVGGEQVSIASRALVLALGGASWPHLGSDGQWQALLSACAVDVEPLRSANGGFERAWTTRFTGAGLPVKGIAAKMSGTDDAFVRGEFLLTAGGIEGSLVYRFSAPLRRQLLANGSATLLVDLAPDKTLQQVLDVLAMDRRGKTLSRVLASGLGLSDAKKQLLFECAPKADLHDSQKLSVLIKSLPVEFSGMCCVDEAISSAGGVRFNAVDQQLMLSALPGVFCAGEMLDWEAPTGGYLLTACFATGRWAGRSAADYVLQQQC